MTFAPARITRSSASGESLAGPMVATIFVRLVIPAYLAGVELIMVRHALPERKEFGGRHRRPVAHGRRPPSGRTAGCVSEQRADRRRVHEPVWPEPDRRRRRSSRRWGLTATVVDDVAEFDRHSSEYIPIEQLKAEGDPRFHDLTSDAWAGNDPRDEFQQRVTTAIDGLIEAHPATRSPSSATVA